MRILYVHSADLSGRAGSQGSVNHIMELCAALKSRGHEIRMLAPGYGRYPGKPPVPVTYVPAPARRFLRTICHELFTPFFMAAQILRFRPRLVYWRQAHLTCLPVLTARLFGLPVIAEVNGLTLREVRTEEIPALRRAVILLLERINYRLASALICVAAGIKDSIRRHYNLNPDRIFVVENGVNLSALPLTDPGQAKKDLGIAPDAPVAGFVGHFFPWDGIETLIAAAPRVLEKFPEARFLIVGHGQWGNHLPGLAREAGVGDAFIFPGRVDFADLHRYLNAFDAACAPYTADIHDKSGSSMKILEYFACGKPVVASRTRGIPEIVAAGEKGLGLLVSPDDPEELAEALIRLFSDPELRRKMGAGGRGYVLSERSWDASAEKTEAVFFRILPV